jgi:hypothetical protein
MYQKRDGLAYGVCRGVARDAGVFAAAGRAGGEGFFIEEVDIRIKKCVGIFSIVGVC